ncbi:MAG: hypothetical protein JWM61_1703 [Micrococcaceae bacterium]|jgi:hypothetical protein|nr:hypothetical protein [Micrococcaceae bacterium]
MGEIKDGESYGRSAFRPGEQQGPQNVTAGQSYAQKSLLLGVLSLFFLGVILGPLAIINARKAEQLQVPAVAGKVLGWLGTAFGALALIALIVIAVSVSSILAPLTASPLINAGPEQTEQIQQVDEPRPVDAATIPTSPPSRTPTPTSPPSRTPTPTPTQSAGPMGVPSSASPTVTPTTTTMSVLAAGELFLQGVCPRNEVIFTLDDLVVAAGTSGQPLDVASATRLAAEYKSATNAAISLFGKNQDWPDEVQQDIDALLGEYIPQVMYAEDLMAQTSPENFVDAYYSGPDQTYSAEVGGRIRASLGLNSDALASCGINR